MFQKTSLIVLCLFLLFSPTNAYANTNEEEYKEFIKYPGFFKNYHNWLADFSLKVASKYEEKDENFNTWVQSVSDSLPDIFPDGGHFNNEAIPELLNAFSTPIKLLQAMNEMRKEMWDKIKAYYSTQDTENLSNYMGYTHEYINEAYIYYYPPQGYVFKIQGNTYEKLTAYRSSGTTNNINFRARTLLSSQGIRVGFGSRDNVSSSIVNTIFSTNLNSIPTFFTLWITNNNPPITLIKKDTQQEKDFIPKITPQYITNIYDSVINNFDNIDDYIANYRPDIQPYLSCPSGNVPLNYDTKDNNYTPMMTRTTIIININSDGTAIYNDEDCELSFRFPIININVNGELTADGIPIAATELPPEPETPETQEDLKTILDYIKNAYGFATDTIKTGAEGLKSIVLGTSSLIFITTSFFDFLPPEILTLFIGGMSIALGLWVFKR